MKSWVEKNDKWIFVALFILLFLGFLVRYQIIGYGIGSGGNYYYSYLPTIVIDHDLNFTNQLESLPYLEKLGHPLFYERNPKPRITETGRTANENSMGPAIFWSPFFITAHGVVLLANHFWADIRTNGFSDVHQIFTLFGSILLSVIGLWLVYRFSAKFYPKWIALSATLAITFGFAVIQYVSVEPSMAHGLTIFTVAAFITYLYNKRNDNSYKKWLFLGILGGLMMHSRWQEGFFFIIPLMYWLRDFWKTKRWKVRRELFLKGTLFVGTIILVFFPQMIVWKILFGSFFRMSESVYTILDFTHPIIFEFLFSFQHSLFVSTPIILLAMFGIPYIYKRDKFFITTLIVALLVHIYVNSSLLELGGNAFGARRMIDSTLLFVLFLSALIDRIKTTRLFWPTMSLIAVLVAFNLIYFLEYNLNLIHRFKPATYLEIIQKAPEIVSNLLKYI